VELAIVRLRISSSVVPVAYRSQVKDLEDMLVVACVERKLYSAVGARCCMRSRATDVVVRSRASPTPKCFLRPKIPLAPFILNTFRNGHTSMDIHVARARSRREMASNNQLNAPSCPMLSSYFRVCNLLLQVEWIVDEWSWFFFRGPKSLCGLRFLCLLLLL
jgi:hypothetical protein